MKYRIVEAIERNAHSDFSLVATLVQEYKVTHYKTINSDRYYYRQYLCDMSDETTLYLKLAYQRLTFEPLTEDEVSNYKVEGYFRNSP